MAAWHGHMDGCDQVAQTMFAPLSHESKKRNDPLRMPRSGERMHPPAKPLAFSLGLHTVRPVAASVTINRVNRWHSGAALAQASLARSVRRPIRWPDKAVTG